MTIGEFLSFCALGVSVIGLYAARRNRASDAFKALSEALNTSGQAIGEFSKMVSEMPELRRQLSDAIEKAESYQSRITDLEALVERQNQRIANLLEQNATLTHELQLRDRVILELRNEIERFGRRVTELQERLAKYEATA